MARRAVILAATAVLLASCSTQETADRPAGPNRTASGPTTSAGSPAPRRTHDEALPTVPATGDAATLAAQLDQVAATLRDPDAAPAEVRRAAEFQQLAARTLATVSEAQRREVSGRMRPEAAKVLRGDVRAARLLHEMAEPQPTLPRWRIVAPPPAAELQGYYRDAQRSTGVPWTYLAAIHLVETRMGRIRGTSTAGAVGPMQFLPSTWDLYGAGGDINDPRDSIFAAARLLKANGAPGDLTGALWHFNPSDNYVRAVSAYARTMQQSRWAYRGYWHWRVLYRHTRGTYVLPVGYPDTRPVLLRGS